MKRFSLKENRKLNIHRISPFPAGMFGRPGVLLLLSFLSILLLLYSGCSREEQKRTRPAVPVKIARVITLDIPVELSMVGTVEAYSTVKVTSRVSGLVTSQLVREGQLVEKGQLLFTVDDKPYLTVLASAKSNLERDRIRLEKALKDAKRYSDLLKKDYVTRDQAEQVQTDAEALKAVIKGDEAALENAMLNLSYCNIKAPIDGKAGAVLLHEGNLIKDNDANNPLMIINQLKPVYVRFAVPEQYLIEVRSRMAKHDLEVRASAPGWGDKVERGRLTFLNNAIQAESGTIDLKAVFENTDSDLWPGMFVNVVLVLGTRNDAVAAPIASVQMGQNGTFVFVLKKDMTVEQRNVTTGVQSGNYIVIDSGLSPDETVVTDGQLMLYPGARAAVIDETKSTGEKQS